MELPIWKKPTEMSPLIDRAKQIQALVGPTKPAIPVGLDIYKKRYGKNGK